ncbi:MAG: FG-GAP repeat protein [Flavobacteriales bacterium]|nr:FG-GAP repeat protein [Flavobacteriales bacterium]
MGAQAWWSAEANQASAYFCVVEKAGDTNGDGYADLLVGAWAFSNGQAQEGRSYLFLGMPSSPTTISNVPDWDVGSGSATAPMGSVVNSAGDFNGDGRSDDRRCTIVRRRLRRPRQRFPFHQQPIRIGSGAGCLVGIRWPGECALRQRCQYRR